MTDHPLTEVEPWKVFRRLCTPATSWKDEAGWRQRAETFAAAIASAPSTEAVKLADYLETARELIQEAKGADGPNGGFVTDHLDFAEHWIDKVQTALRQPPPLPSGDEVERAARAIWDTKYGDEHPDSWDRIGEATRERQRHQARAAIAALRSPSEVLPDEEGGGDG